MEWLNYNHLYYFWKVLRAGSLTRACEELRLAPPTVSAQLRRLEQQLGEKLLTKVGRRLVPTEMGQVAFRYADQIFSLGQELMDALKQRSTDKPLRLVVGVDDVLPKEIAQELIDPALRLPKPVVLRCHEANLEALMAKLAIHEIDIVLSDAAATPSLNIRAYNHLFGEVSRRLDRHAEAGKKLSSWFSEVPEWRADFVADGRYSYPSQARSMV